MTGCCHCHSPHSFAGPFLESPSIHYPNAPIFVLNQSGVIELQSPLNM
jgi:hypothetical protein